MMLAMERRRRDRYISLAWGVTLQAQSFVADPQLGREIKVGGFFKLSAGGATDT